MSFANIISAIGNNNSVYPLIVRDCGIEVPTKIILTYNQNKNESKQIAKLAARERFLDEYSVSAVWLGGIPLVGKLADYFIKKSGFNPDINLKLFKGDTFQNIDENIKNFKGKVPQNVIDELQKVKNNKALYEKLLAGKFLLSTSIPILFMGWILPKLIFASSARKIEKQRQKELISKKRNVSSSLNFQKSIDFMNNKKISFKGNWISTAANFSTVDKMFVTDGGYAVGRVATARNKNEALDVGFKMTGMMFLNFIAPKYIERFLNKCFNVSLDPKLLSDKNFITSIKNKTLKLPISDSAKDILNFIDNNPESMFVNYAEKFGKLKMLKTENQKVRDPRSFIEIDKLAAFKKDIERFSKTALSKNDIKAYARKACTVKSAGILLNIAISSILLAYALPKAQFAFRKIITGSDLEPGLAPAKQSL